MRNNEKDQKLALQSHIPTIRRGGGLEGFHMMRSTSFWIAINRPIEMLVTALNVMGDSTCTQAVAESENVLDIAQ